MLKKNEVLNESNLAEYLIDLQKNEKRRKMESIYANKNPTDLKKNKINKLRSLLLLKVEKILKKQENKKISMMIKSIVSNLAPVIVSSMDSYFNPHLLTTILSVNMIFFFI